MVNLDSSILQHVMERYYPISTWYSISNLISLLPLSQWKLTLQLHPQTLWSQEPHVAKMSKTRLFGKKENTIIGK